jgi:hypothetical protein
MKARLTLVVAVALGAFAATVPSALAEGRLAGSPERIDAVTYFHANELATAAQSGGIDLGSYRDAGERAATALFVSAAAPTADSNQNSVEWGQIGIAFGVGLLLALGLAAAVRFRPTRAITH